LTSLLTHIIRPDMEGVETVMHFKQTRPELKVIVMSGGTPDARQLERVGFGLMPSCESELENVRGGG
jgi:DNA-binding NtrC family response regulator